MSVWRVVTFARSDAAYVCVEVLFCYVQTYHTLQDMRVVFLDGTVLDTADPASREAFLKVRVYRSFID